jgi:hypothetical protein
MTILEFLFLEALTLAIPSVLILFAMYLLGYGGRGSVGRARRSSQPSLEARRRVPERRADLAHNKGSRSASTINADRSQAQLKNWREQTRSQARRR